jgi:hypothetical protein
MNEVEEDGPWNDFKLSDSEEEGPWNYFKPKKSKEKSQFQKKSEVAAKGATKGLTSNVDFLSNLFNQLGNAYAEDVIERDIFAPGYAKNAEKSRENPFLLTPKAEEFFEKQGFHEAESPIEKILEKASEYGSGFGSLKLLGKSPTAANVAKEALFGAATGATSSALEQQGYEGIIPEIASVAVGHKVSSPYTYKNAASRLYKAKNMFSSLDNFKEGLGEITGKTLRLSPENVKQDALKVSKDLGIEKIPTSVLADNKVLRAIEGANKYNFFANEVYGDISRNANEKFVSQIKDAWKDAEFKFGSPAEGNSALKQAIRSNAQENQGVVSELYSNLKKDIDLDVDVDLKELSDSINKDIQSLKVSKAPDQSKKDAIKTLENFKASILGADQEALKTQQALIGDIERNIKKDPRLASTLSPILEKEKGILEKMKNPGATLNELIETKKDLYRQIDFPGLIDRTAKTKDYALSNTSRYIRDTLKKYGNEVDDAFKSSFEIAEKAAGDNAKTYKNDIILSLKNGTAPRDVLLAMRNPNKVEEIRKALGPEMFEAASDLFVWDMIGNKALANDTFRFGNAKNILKDPNDAESLNRVLGPQRTGNLQKIARAADLWERSMSEFANNSKTAVISTIGQSGAAILSALPAILTGNFTPLLALGGTAAAQYGLAKLMTDRKFQEGLLKSVTRGAKATTRAEKQAALKSLYPYIQEIQKEMDKSSSRESKEINVE